MDDYPSKRARITPLKLPSREDPLLDSQYTSGKKEKSRKGRKRRQKRGTHTINKPQWIPHDDYLLINSFVQVCDPLEVFEQVKFSKVFSLKDVEARWKDLLTNEARCSVALDAIAKLTDLEKSVLDRKIPFNEFERNLLLKVQCKDVFEKSNGLSPNMEPFHKLLHERRNEFFRSRTPDDLFHCWSLMRMYGLVYPDPYAHTDGVDLEDLEHRIVMGKYDGALSTLRDRTIPQTMYSHSAPSMKKPHFTSELVLQELIMEKHKQLRRVTRRMRLASEEAHRWTEAVEQFIGQPVKDSIPSYAYASLCAHHSRFLIKSRQTSFGRATASTQPDINLSCERYSRRMSRIQGYIRLTNEEDAFIVGNLGRRPILVNDTPLLKGEEMILQDDSILTVERICLRFRVNSQMIRDLHPLFPTKPSELSLHSSIPLIIATEGSSEQEASTVPTSCPVTANPRSSVRSKATDSTEVVAGSLRNTSHAGGGTSRRFNDKSGYSSSKTQNGELSTSSGSIKPSASSRLGPASSQVPYHGLNPVGFSSSVASETPISPSIGPSLTSVGRAPQEQPSPFHLGSSLSRPLPQAETNRRKQRLV